MTQELFVGLTPYEVAVAYCDEMNKRVPGRQYVIERHVSHICIWEEVMNEAVPLVTESHDTLNRLIDVLTPEELRKMGDWLYGHWLNTVRPSTLDFEQWLIKRDLSAFVSAVLVAVGVGNR